MDTYFTQVMVYNGANGYFLMKLTPEQLHLIDWLNEHDCASIDYDKIDSSSWEIIK